MSLCSIAIDILQSTNDGNALDPTDLALVQLAVNGDLNECGEVALYELHTRATSGEYRKPWLCGVEHLTKDHQGYVYWKGENVEHYSFYGDQEAEKRAAVKLAQRCRHLEALGEDVNPVTAVWNWEAYRDRQPAAT